MFGARAFRSWTHIVIGATGFSLLFLVIMVMAERVIEGRARVTGPAILVSAAAFLGYLGAAWFVRWTEQ